MAKKKKKRGRPKGSKNKQGKKLISPEISPDLPEEKKEIALEFRQQQFVDEFLVDLNATQAAIRAGYSKKTARVIGPENLSKPAICAAINRAIRERRDRTKMQGDEVLLEVARLARSDILNYVNFGPDGVAIRDSKELAEGEARAISQISETTNAQGVKQFKFKLHDKVKSLDLLAKHLKLYNSSLEVTGKDGEPLIPTTDLGRLTDEQLAKLADLIKATVVDGGQD